MGNVVSKLLKLKEWVTIPDAARHLSQILSESVSDADILQMALDGHLKLSVLFPNRAYARIGRITPSENVPRYELPSLDGHGTITCADGYLLQDPRDSALQQTGVPFVHFDEQVAYIDGLWDLAMIGSERLDIEHELQMLIGGPDVTLINIRGTFLNRNDGTWAALQERFIGQTAYHFSDACSLGADCMRVVRTSEILALQSRLNGSPLEKPLANRERDTLLAIIATLCKDAGYDYKKPAKTAGIIQSSAAEMGVAIGETTIEGHLKKIPEALEVRMK